MYYTCTKIIFMCMEVIADKGASNLKILSKKYPQILYTMLQACISRFNGSGND